MRSRGLQQLLGLCALVALSPVVPWSLAALFDGIDDRWLGSLSGFAVTFPVALGCAAVVLAMHGLLLQRAMADRLSDEFAAHPGHGFASSSPGQGLDASALQSSNGSERAMVGVAATVATPAGAEGAAAADATDATPEEPRKLGGTMAVKERPPGFGDPRSKKSTGSKVQRVGRRYGHRVTGIIRRKFRDNFRL